ncbi:MAG: kelch repeat-containing protein [Planctomycetota bacterium]
MGTLRSLVLLVALTPGRTPAQLHWQHVDAVEGCYGHAAAYDAARQRTVVFGGHDHRGVSGDTWEWDGIAWTHRRPAHAPPAREDHAMVFDAQRGRVVLFGGRTGGNRFGDTWEWDGSDWTMRVPSGSPTARHGAGMAWDDLRGVVVVFGGNDGSGYRDDTWEWDGATWTERNPLHRPPPRSEGALTFARHLGKVVLFAGACPFGGPCAYRDTWLWDGTDWAQVPGEFPSYGRWGHAIASDDARQRVVLFGGSDEPGHYYDDTWEFDGSVWQQVVPTRNLPGRADYAMVWDARAQSVLVIAGIGWTATFGDVWAWWGPPTFQFWSRLSAGAPPAREWPAFAYMDATQRCVMFGGLYGSTETWEFDGALWRLREPAAVPPATLGAQMASDGLRCWLVTGWSGAELWWWDGFTWQRAFTSVTPPGGEGQALTFDTARQELVLLTAGSGATPSATYVSDRTDWQLRRPVHAPPPRTYAAMAYDASRQRVVLYGGSDGISPRADTWEWDGSDWTERQPAHAPPPAARHRLVYDVARGRTVLLGGDAGTTTSLWEWGGDDWRERRTDAGPTAAAQLGAAYDRGRRAVVEFGGYPPETWLLTPAHAARFDVIGAGCHGQNGVPTLALAGGQLPWLGDTLSVEVSNLPPVPFLVLFLGASHTQWGPVPLPARLDNLGMSGCTLHVSGEVVIPLVGAGGRSRWTLTIPTEPALAGGAFYNQTWQVDWLANPGNATVSDATAAVVGMR